VSGIVLVFVCTEREAPLQGMTSSWKFNFKPVVQESLNHQIFFRAHKATIKSRRRFTKLKQPQSLKQILQNVKKYCKIDCVKYD
jgi:hypothetical protein